MPDLHLGRVGSVVHLKFRFYSIRWVVSGPATLLLAVCSCIKLDSQNKAAAGLYGRASLGPRPPCRSAGPRVQLGPRPATPTAYHPLVQGRHGHVSMALARVTYPWPCHVHATSRTARTARNARAPCPAIAGRLHRRTAERHWRARAALEGKSVLARKGRAKLEGKEGLGETFRAQGGFRASSEKRERETSMPRMPQGRERVCRRRAGHVQRARVAVEELQAAVYY